jgi:hypothetical protein
MNVTLTPRSREISLPSSLLSTYTGGQLTFRTDSTPLLFRQSNLSRISEQLRVLERFAHVESPKERKWLVAQ